MSMRRSFVRCLQVSTLALLGFVSIAPAQAGVCADQTTCTFNFSNTNVIGLTVNIEVIVNNISFANTQITVNYLSDNVTDTALGIDKFAYNSAGNVLPGVVLPPAFQTENCSGLGAPLCQMDGFGDFDMEISDPASTLLNFSFFLNGKETNFADNANGGEFALHVRYDGNCSAYVSDGRNNGPTCDPNDRTVPEPATLLLLGVAMGGLGFSRRRIRRIGRA